jgi:chaperonin GroES
MFRQTSCRPEEVMNRASMHAAAPAFRPSHDNLLVRLLFAKAPGGVMRPNATCAAVDWADVVAVGPGWRTSTGRLIPPVIAKGDCVALLPHSAARLILGGDQFAVVNERDVLGVLGRPAAEAQFSVRAEPPAEPSAERDAAEPVLEARDESLETNVAPSILSRTDETADDLH